MTQNEARDIFTDETSWSPEFFQAQCALHGIEPLDDEWFGQTASRLWDALTDKERATFTAEYTAFYAA